MGTKTLKVIPVRKANKPIVWRLSHGSASGGPGNYPKVSVAPKTNSKIIFEIVNPQDITFSQDPIWIAEGSAKPTGGVVAPFCVVSGANTPLLTVQDDNTDLADYTYVLNFNNAPSLDPIIKNGGGGPGSKRFVWYAIGALAVAALLFVLFGSNLSAERPVR
jgi:hypothetical protein